MINKEAKQPKRKKRKGNKMIRISKAGLIVLVVAGMFLILGVDKAFADDTLKPDWSRVIVENGQLCWRDAGRGIHEPGMFYAQVITPLTEKEIELYYTWKENDDLAKEQPLDTRADFKETKGRHVEKVAARAERKTKKEELKEKYTSEDAATVPAEAYVIGGEPREEIVIGNTTTPATVDTSTIANNLDTIEEKQGSSWDTDATVTDPEDELLTPREEEIVIGGEPREEIVIGGEPRDEIVIGGKAREEIVIGGADEPAPEEPGTVLPEMDIVTLDELPSGVAVAKRATIATDDKLQTEESGASGGFGISTLDLVTGEITVLNPAGTTVITPEAEDDYLKSIQGMIGTIERQMERESDPSNIEKLQIAKNYLVNINTQPETIVTDKEAVEIGGNPREEIVIGGEAREEIVIGNTTTPATVDTSTIANDLDTIEEKQGSIWDTKETAKEVIKTKKEELKEKYTSMRAERKARKEARRAAFKARIEKHKEKLAAYRAEMEAKIAELKEKHTVDRAEREVERGEHKEKNTLYQAEIAAHRAEMEARRKERKEKIAAAQEERKGRKEARRAAFRARIEKHKEKLAAYRAEMEAKREEREKRRAELRAERKAKVEAARKARMEKIEKRRAKEQAENAAKKEAEMKAKREEREKRRAELLAKREAARKARMEKIEKRRAKEQAENAAKKEARKKEYKKRRAQKEAARGIRMERLGPIPADAFAIKKKAVRRRGGNKIKLPSTTIRSSIPVAVKKSSRNGGYSGGYKPKESQRSIFNPIKSR
ncbi:MAG: hypothetical protein U9Q24_00525 [Candidatus Ratteibacteria bacterium]|nr:hypothetical protein [Candidatus Ratteibacteria bacterium]